MSISIENLSKTFDEKKWVLQDLNFRLADEKFSALLGPSGCGKTTLLRILAGLEHATQGIVRVGTELWSDEPGKFFLPPQKRNVGMVFQSYAIWPHLSVFENVAFPLRVRRLPEAELRQRVTHMLELVQLGALSERMPHALSGGQQQRVALARALVQRPRLLLLDEPLSNLDASLREEMRRQIRGLQQQFKITAVIVTHDWADARSLCDEVVVLREGRIEQQGAPQNIIERPASDFVRQLVGA